MSISRRTVLANSAAFAVLPRAARAATAVAIHLDPASRMGTVAPDFMGLSFETSSVAVPGLFSAENHTYVRLVRNLGRQGVIRIGGNTSDFASYDANGTALSAPKGTVVTARNLDQLRGFMEALDWKLIWGLDLGQANLGQQSLDNTVEEARAVMDVMGSRLLALEIGNEPDLFRRAGHRPANYDYAAWHAEYRRYKAAIRAGAPNAPFAGPDIAGGADWLEAFARDEGSDIALLTAHHYIGYQADAGSTLEKMLAGEAGYRPTLARYQAAATAAQRPYRICETGSYSGGGKAGVSDSFAAALWMLDYLFVLASSGCGGINPHTGVNHLGVVSYYTPIHDDLAGHYGAAPEYYGLLAFAQIAKGELIATRCEAGGVNLTAYGMQESAGVLTLSVINKDLSRDAQVEVTAPGALHQAMVLRLTGPSLSATNGTSLGGARVAADGTWTGGQFNRVATANGKARLEVPAGSAALLRLRL